MSVVEIPEPKAPERIDRESARQLHINWIKQLEAAFESRVVSALRSVLKEVSASLGSLTAQGAPGEPFISLDNLGRIGTAWDERVTDKLLPDMADVYLAGAQGTGLSMAGTATAIPDVVNHEAVNWLQQSNNRLKGIGDDAWQSVRSELVDGLQRGESIDELKKRVRSTLGVVESRARMIARTEVIGATNAGAFAQAIAMGAETKTWLATDDAKTRPTHNAADDQAVPMDDLFTVGGSLMRFPHDPYGPPGETINCRCTLIFDETPLCKCTPSWAKSSLVAAGAPDCKCSGIVGEQKIAVGSYSSEELGFAASRQLWDADDDIRSGAMNYTFAAVTTDNNVNNLFRQGIKSGLIDEDTAMHIANFDKAFHVASVASDHDVIVYRGLRNLDSDVFLQFQTVGSEFVDDAPGFASPRVKSASSYARGEGNNILMNITLPARTPVLGGIAPDEIIINRGSRLRITKVYWDDDKLTVDVELVS